MPKTNAVDFKTKHNDKINLISWYEALVIKNQAKENEEKLNIYLKRLKELYVWRNNLSDYYYKNIGIQKASLNIFSNFD